MFTNRVAKSSSKNGARSARTSFGQIMMCGLGQTLNDCGLRTVKSVCQSVVIPSRPYLTVCAYLLACCMFAVPLSHWHEAGVLNGRSSNPTLTNHCYRIQQNYRYYCLNGWINRISYVLCRYYLYMYSWICRCCIMFSFILSFRMSCMYSILSIFSFIFIN